ncbi:acyl-CoA thioesterase [Novosphingobium taihuense]|uniref:4-hydroxybenzoyl-CoA thioesterase n=1 Tax=Novosphingobium taihuense TaxID=260085 RepID=A0A7W7AAH2_9SPHN|nr:thioesterase family protein [Novosphingobium taihuense]MBB4613361.1 4-hydroxybenzoyl-CoA thioesterase [Novosphingobium taihuense]TWH85501.1 4-hydroxybenzoyl-CoA thioesterase [Novosphingobium taihuense]
MTFISTQLVRFAHVDAAGIVFYPRYFEMLNAAVEDYFAQGIGVDFAEMHIRRGLGVPTVTIQTTFFSPSKLGDLLDFRLSVPRVGRSSMELVAEVLCGDERRLEATATLVCMDLEAGRSVAWPDDMRPKPMTGEHAVAAA